MAACAKCGFRDALPGRKSCSFCRSGWYKLRSGRRKDGLCIRCGLLLEPDELLRGNSRCGACRARDSSTLRKKRSKWSQQGLCMRCGTSDDVTRQSARYCESCYLRNVSRSHFRSHSMAVPLLDVFRKQGGICPYTGRKLTLGINTSLDHILPKARGGANDIGNMQWVYLPINYMKHELPEAEFLTLVAEIFRHRQLFHDGAITDNENSDPARYSVLLRQPVCHPDRQAC